MSDAPSAIPPVPQGLYAPAARHGSLVFTAGMTPRKNGVLQFTGPVEVDADPGQYREAIELACQNALAAAELQLAPGERIAAIVSMTVYLQAAPGFTRHAKFADIASGWLRERLGEPGIGSRAAIGVASLPGNAPVEIQMVVAVG